MATTVTMEEQAAQARTEACAIRPKHAIFHWTDTCERWPRTASEFSGMCAKPPHDLTQAEFEQWLQDVATAIPSAPLPADFSRADIYNDHD